MAGKATMGAAGHAGRVFTALDPRRLGGRLLDVAFPAACVGCGAEGRALCETCALALGTRRGLPAGVLIGLPSDVPLPLVQLEWCAPFRGVVRAALHALKYRGERRLAAPLGQAAAARWAEAAVGGDLLVHVPVHEGRRAARGYDQAELLAGAVAGRLGIPAVRALRRTRSTIPQFELDRAHRAANVHGAFELERRHAASLAGSWAILVDDVATSGATLVACAEVLLGAGASAVSALTIARET